MSVLIAPLFSHDSNIFMLLVASVYPMYIWVPLKSDSLPVLVAPPDVMWLQCLCSIDILCIPYVYLGSIKIWLTVCPGSPMFTNGSINCMLLALSVYPMYINVPIRNGSLSVLLAHLFPYYSRACILLIASVYPMYTLVPLKSG